VQVSDHLPDTLSNLVLNDLPRKYDLVSLPPYVYTTLPSTSSFRILELFSGEHNDEIAFRLHVEDWNAPPLYEAISYTWGTDDKICTFCDGHVLYVTPNLRDGLRRMRYIDRSRFLWADAACIDQGSEQHSLEERGHQVSNMRKIYEQASQVLVWLGEDDGEHAPIAIATMREIVSACCTKKNMTPAQLKDCDDIYSIALAARSEDISQDSPESWQSVAWFFSRPWYR
jgi:hypothetical protein